MSPHQTPAPQLTLTDTDRDADRLHAQELAGGILVACPPCSEQDGPGTPLSVELMGSYNRKRLSLISQLVHLYLPASAHGVSAQSADGAQDMEEEAQEEAPGPVLGHTDDNKGGKLHEASNVSYVKGLQADDGSVGVRTNVLVPGAYNTGSPVELMGRRSVTQGRLPNFARVFGFASPIVQIWLRVAATHCRDPLTM